MSLFKSNRKKKAIRFSRPSNTKNRGKTNFSNILKTIHGTPNVSLIILTGLFLLAGLLMVYSASSVSASATQNGDSFYYLKRQFIWMILGIILAYCAYITPLQVFKRLGVILIIVGVFLLLYMLPEALFGTTIERIVDGQRIVETSGAQMPFVLTKNGATRWIDLGFFDFQPTELVKIGFVMYLAAWLSRKLDKPKVEDELSFHLRTTLFPFMLIFAIISGLIVLQRDFDTTVIIALSVLITYFVSGSDRIHNIGTLFISLFSLFGGFIAMFMEEYRRIRIESFVNLFLTGQPSDASGADFQLWNGLVGLGNGWFFGRGYTESRIKEGWLQEAAYTDSIVVVIGEEFGFMGILLLLIAFLYLAQIGYNIAQNAPDKFSQLLAVGLTSWIVVQAFLNIGAHLAVIPFGGLPLPFFTYGGSGMISVLVSIGILLNISKKEKK